MTAVRAHILQHVPFESPGSILTALQALGADVGDDAAAMRESVCRPRRDVDLLVVMGGPMSVNDEADYPWLVDEKALVADAIANGRAVLGVCLGAQVIASALGYRVFKNREPEIGWFPIQPTVEGRGHGPQMGRAASSTGTARRSTCRPAPRFWRRAPGASTRRSRSARACSGCNSISKSRPSDVQNMVEHGRDELVPGRFVQQEAEILAAPASDYEAHQRDDDGGHRPDDGRSAVIRRHSCRSACRGSIRQARLAGTRPEMAATMPRTIRAAAAVQTSVGGTPKS